MLILLSKIIFQILQSISVSLSLKKKRNMKLLFFQSKKVLYSFTLSTSLIWDAWAKLLAKSLRKRKKNLQINMLFIKEYKNTYQYSRYVKQNSLKKSFLLTLIKDIGGVITRISLRKEPWKRWTSPQEFHKFQCHLSGSYFYATFPLFLFLVLSLQWKHIFSSTEALCMAVTLLSRYLDFYS